MKTKSATRECAKYATKESGKSEGKMADYMQAFKLLKEQHKNSKRGNPSLLLKLWNECKQVRIKK